jgi:hypothetical protein
MKRDRKTKEQYREEFEELRVHAQKLSHLLARSLAYIPTDYSVAVESRITLRVFDAFIHETRMESET